MYYLAQNNEKTGPFTLEQLRVMWHEGGVYPQMLFWEQGMADWQPLSLIAASRLGLDTAEPSPPALPASIADPLSALPAASREPSAYDLPASHLPAAPVLAAPMAASLSGPSLLAPAPPPAPAPDAPNSLIGPTRLPGAGATAPAGTALSPGVSSGVPPAAYLSLVLALLGPFFLQFSFVGLLPGAAMLLGAIVCGHTARAAIKQSGGRLPGKKIATAGLIIGYLGALLSVAVFVGFMVWAISASDHFHP